MVLKLALVLSLVATTPVAALEPLPRNRYVNDRLIAARIADRIRRECPSINARMIYAYSQARALKNHALKQGYSEAQIDSFLKSKEDKARIYATAEKYLADNGARKGDAESFCRIGRQEIARKTVTGSLLSAK